MGDEGAHRPRVAVNVSAGQLMAGFAVSINGRFWVSTEADIPAYLDTHNFANPTMLAQTDELGHFPIHLLSPRESQVREP
jgi:hypothetical protein